MTKTTPGRAVYGYLRCCIATHNYIITNDIIVVGNFWHRAKGCIEGGLVYVRLCGNCADGLACTAFGFGCHDTLVLGNLVVGDAQDSSMDRIKNCKLGGQRKSKDRQKIRPGRPSWGVSSNAPPLFILQKAYACAEFYRVLN